MFYTRFLSPTDQKYAESSPGSRRRFDSSSIIAHR